jgi:anti-sigma factor RsiW
MNRCPETERIEAWLDGELPAGAAQAFESHLAGCRDCAREAAALRRLYAHLRALPLMDPGPGLTERILDRAAPSRVRRRQLAVVGWVYTAVSAVSTFAFISWIVRPETHAWLGTMIGAAWTQVIRAGLMALGALTEGLLRLQHGTGLFDALGGSLVFVVARALAALGADPWFAASLWAGLILCATLIWWMRPRPLRIVGRDRHVGILGF